MIRIHGLDDPDDPVVWERSKLLPDGRILFKQLTASAEARLLKAFGREWLDAHLAEAEAEVQAFGVQ